MLLQHDVEHAVLCAMLRMLSENHGLLSVAVTCCKSCKLISFAIFWHGGDVVKSWQLLRREE